MYTVIKLLTKELEEWKEEYETEKLFFKGEEGDKYAVRSFLECNTHIIELQKAIEILNKHKDV